MTVGIRRADRTHRRLVRSQAEAAWKTAKEVIDLGLKVVAALAAAGIAYVGHEFQSASQVTSLLQAREQSDTQIRAEMFKAITDRLFGEKAVDLPPEKKAVFSELLALNFHEHIELKPLMLDIDSALEEKMKTEEDPSSPRGTMMARRQELWSVARRVRVRQVSMLVADVTHNKDAGSSRGLIETTRSLTADLFGWIGLVQAASSERPRMEGGYVELIGVRFARSKSASTSVPVIGLGCDVRPGEGQNGYAGEPIWIAGPGGRSTIALILEKADWKAERFNIRIKLDAGDDPTSPTAAPQTANASDGSKSGERLLSPAISGQSAVLFRTTWFDFPLTDNTLLVSGDRFAIFIDEVCQQSKGSEKAIRLGVLWFPTDYFPPRERPTNYRQTLDLLRLRGSG